MGNYVPKDVVLIRMTEILEKQNTLTEKLIDEVHQLNETVRSIKLENSVNFKELRAAVSKIFNLMFIVNYPEDQIPLPPGVTPEEAMEKLFGSEIK